MNLEILEYYISKYTNKDIWKSILDLEMYKWYAVSHFQKHLSDSFVSLYEEITVCFEKSDNLLLSHNYFPIKMLRTFAQNEEKALWDSLNYLFDKRIPLRDRVSSFIEQTNAILLRLKDKGYSDWKERNNVQTFQDTHAISVYLYLRHPETYYIYKWGVFKDFSKQIEHPIQSRDKVDKLVEFYNLCGEIKKRLLKETEFLFFYKDWLKSHSFNDPNYNLLTQDFIYAVARYFNSSKIIESNKSVVLNAEPLEIEAVEFKTIVGSIPIKQKYGKINYEKRDSLLRNLGTKGECWVIKYERERLKKLGIEFEIDYVADHNDNAGYDIISVEDDGKTPRYIEVKTTSGDINQPFFCSQNELQTSEQLKEHYYIYRVYNFKDVNKKVSLFIIHGSFKDLKGEAVTYKFRV